MAKEARAAGAVEARRRASLAALDDRVHRLIRQGYAVTYRGDGSAQLTRPKRFSAFWALVWLVLGLGIGFLVYLAWYLGKRDRTVYLSIGADGKLRETRR